MGADKKSLRGWQAEALPAIFSAIDDRPLVRAVMGAGKSVLIAELISRVPDTLNIVVTTPNVRLVDDLAETIEWWTEGTIRPGKWYTHAKDRRRVTVVCNSSLADFAQAWGDDPLELWVCDEAHRSECEQVIGPIKKLTPYRRVGFSATPWLADDEEGLTQFDTLAFDYTAQQAMTDGVVVPFRVRHYQSNRQISLNEACAEAIKSAVLDGMGPGLANAGNIEDAEEFAEYLEHEYDIAAAAIHSELSRDEEQRRIDALQAGELDTLVHVNMLAEGVNLPWLRWLCCRRPVGSKVRFAQEVGRVLRSAPGKEYATIFDPHNLFSVFKLDDEAVLSGGGAEQRDPLRLPALHLDFLCGQIKEDPEPPETYRDVPVRLIDPTTSYLIKLRLQLQYAGALEPEIQSRHWRGESPSHGQIKYVRALRKVADYRSIPEEHRQALEIAIAAAPGLKKGAVSDLIGVLKCIKGLREWPEYVDVGTDRMGGEVAA